jgi:hypothetical protein
MNKYGESEAQLHLFLTSTPDKSIRNNFTADE